MMIPILENESIFLEYLDDENDDYGFKLTENAPEEAIIALESYNKRANQLLREMEIE